MSFEIVRDDLAHRYADAVVLPSNERLVIDGGSGLEVAERAGLRKVRRACKKLGGCAVGEARATTAFAYPARYLIHAVGPVWRSERARECSGLLRSTYDAALNLADELGCVSVALPLISTGVRECPAHVSLEIALTAIREFLEQHDMQITLVLYDRSSMAAALDVYGSVAAYIDDHYVDERRERLESGLYERPSMSMPAQPLEAPSGRRKWWTGHRLERRQETWPEDAAEDATYATAPALLPRDTCDDGMAFGNQGLERVLSSLDAGFSETLLELIDKSGLTDAQVYKRANLTRQHFSKIRSNPSYRPTQKTALALCVALELDLDATRDLLGRAGYTLSHARKFDVIVEYFITCGIYDIFKINEALYSFDQPLLG